MVSSEIIASIFIFLFFAIYKAKILSMPSAASIISSLIFSLDPLKWEINTLLIALLIYSSSSTIKKVYFLRLSSLPVGL